MKSNVASIPDDLAACRALIETQQAVNDQLRVQLEQLRGTAGQQAETIDSQQKLIEKLQYELDLFKRHIFGQRRERFVEDPQQRRLFAIADAPSEAAPQ
jgi:hypothetical protein